MKKLMSILQVFTFSCLFLFANPTGAVKEYILENGLTVFLLEDSSSALVNVELKIRAGFADQTPETCGFFKLYSQIIQDSNPKINFDLIDCNADSTTYTLTSTTSQLENKISDLADGVFDTQFSDDLLIQKLAQMKNQVTEDASSMAFLINSAIDSKVFSDSPWKHDSGIYPSVFKKNTEKTARNYLTDIKNYWYTPQNSALFICGNFNSEQIYTCIKNTFGKYYSSAKLPNQKKLQPINTHKKFVIYDDQLSDQLTQVVVQYTLLNLEQADILSQALNNKYSSFKQQVLSSQELNIPGDEYINVAQAHEQASTRLIFQTLIQPPEDKKIKTNSLEQSLKFLQQIENIPVSLSLNEFQYSKATISYNMNKICQTSQSLMTNLADFWTTLPYTAYKSTEEIETLLPNSLTTAKMFSRINEISKTDYVSTLETIKTEEPFVFVIINSADYKKNKKAYVNAGFEEITSKNSSWYVQQMNQNIRDQFKPDTENYSGRGTSDNDYYKKNLSKIETSKLTNGITVTSKQNQNSSTISILMNIKGGKLNSPDNNGFEEVMTNLLAALIQKEIYNSQLQQIILGAPVVSSNCDLFTSSISIECDAEDFEAVCAASAKALIYSDIPPASADRAVSSRQYKKRLENGSSVSQMYASAINTIYPKSDLTKIFETKNDILLDTTYNKILSEYPSLLNADRYSFIVCGNFQTHQQVEQILQKNFVQLEQNGFSIAGNIPETTIPKNKSQKIQLVHTFLTDIPAEKAGPMPAVLIPTTEFLDPVIYIIPSPAADEKEQAIFNATFNYLEKLVIEEINSNARISKTTVQIQLPKPQMPFAAMIFSNVAHTKELDSAYKSAVLKLSDQISKTKKSTLEDIKNYWIFTQLNETGTNSGTAQLLQKGFENFPDNPKPDFYLQQYNTIQTGTFQNFQEILKYFQPRPDYRIYSVDSKN